VQKQLDSALSNQEQLEAQIVQLQSTDAELQVAREQLTAALEKQKLLEAQVAELEKVQAELDSSKAQIHEALQNQQKLNSEVSRLKAREAELSKDLTEKAQIQGQLTAQISNLLKSATDPEEGRQLLDAAISARKALESEVARLKVNFIMILT